MWFYLRTRFDWLLGRLVGYGHRPWRAAWGFVGLWIATYVFYQIIAPLGIMVPTDPNIYSSDKIPLECRLDWINFRGPQPIIA